MIPVILCGGSGTRLWPLSRRSFPKQFNALLDTSLLERTVDRLAPLGDPWVVATDDTAVLTRRTLERAGQDPGRALFEPVGRNTAPAVALAVRRLLHAGHGDEVVGVFPADHLVEDRSLFHRAVRLGEACARRGQVVTLGIRPTHPATGYGYIEIEDQVFLAEDELDEGEADAGGEALAAHRVSGFREKPDRATAQAFLEAGRFLWNAGMFVFRVSTMAACFERLLPEVWQPLGELDEDLGNLEEIYRRLPAESFDVGIMEKLDAQVSIPCDPGWSDLGSWDEVARVRPSSDAAFEVPAEEEGEEGEEDEGAGDGADRPGNFVLGWGDKVYGLVGVEGLVVVDTADATLVARRGATQKVKELVEELRAAGRPEADEHPFEHRPWGSFEILRDTDDFKSKILRVLPGQRLSYQSHRHRSEHWVIVKGHPEVVLDGEVLRPRPGEAVYIPQGAKHRIANPGDTVVEIVEVQLGSYFGEDDIIRYEDDYDRS